MTRGFPAGLLALALLVAGCGGGGGEGGTASTAEPAKSASSGATAVAKTSKYDAGPRAGEEEIDEDLAKQGETLFQNKGCSACHGFGVKMSGPDLAGVSMRRTSKWMEQQILHPDLMVKEDPISRELFAKHALQMPNQGLTAAEAKAVIEYLKHRDHEAAEGDD